MYKLLIVDDEPLVQVGIKSMLDWQELGIEVAGTAVNGKAALELIEAQRPDIVITDIRMPVMDGLELLRRVNEEYGTDAPVFLMLTSYEDFKLAREAIRLRAFDYLVKIELTPESLKETMAKVTAHLEQTSRPAGGNWTEQGLRSFTDKFMISLLNNLFESEEQMLLQARDLNIGLEKRSFLCCYGSLEAESGDRSPEQQAALCGSARQMLGELAAKYRPCYTIALDPSHFALIFTYEEAPEPAAEAKGAGSGTPGADKEAKGAGSEGPGSAEDVRAAETLNAVRDTLSHIAVSLHNYYSVALRCGIGFTVSRPLSISESYQYSRLSYRETDKRHPVQYMEPGAGMSHEAFHFALFQKDLTRAFEEYNSELLASTLHELCELLGAHPNHFVQALDAASNILYLAISLMGDGGRTLSGIFAEYPEGYMSLYRKTTVEQIVGWLDFFCRSMCAVFDERKRDYKNRIVAEVKEYIGEHVTEKLTLNEVAARFGISPGYLSQLFGRYNETGFSEYVNARKIEAAKAMLRENSKVYEVADALSFGSEFYFSKVFKKLEGMSPTEYVNGGPKG